MACAMVLRKRPSRELSFGAAPPMKKMRTSAANVMSVLTALTRSISQTSNEERGQKRKRDNSTERDPSVERPVKRQRLLSNGEASVTNVTQEHPVASPDQEHDAVAPVEQGPGTSAYNGQQPQASGSEAMDTDSAITEPTIHESAPEALQPDSDNNNEAAMDTTEADANPTAASAKAETLEGAVGGEPLAMDSAGAAAAPPVFDEQFETDHQLICEIHPDVDPVYIREQLTLYINDPSRVSTVTFDIYANEDLPQRADREAREQALAEREQLSSMTFDLETFLARYPDPMSTFNVKDTDVTELYYDHAEVFLKNQFRLVQVAFIKSLLRRCGFHLTPAYLALEDRTTLKAPRGKTKNRKFPRSNEYEYPEDADEDFYWERLFLLNKDQILDHVEAVKEAKRLRFEEAQREGRLRECAICLSPDVFLEDMAPCADGHHLFCLDCVRHSTEELLGQGKAAFPCLDTTCSAHFSLHALEKALRAQTLSLVVRRIQTEELRLAQIENIVTCPFCPYAVIIPDGNSSSVFHCENPDCMEDSCRNCRDIAHVPFTCDEFKKKKEEDMLHYVENQMAEAMIRQCPKCDLRFFKEEGCNTMTCSTCRTQMCYICREVISGYNHFRGGSACSNSNNMQQLHRDEVAKAFKESEAKFKEENPELNHDRVKLLHNPLEVLNI